MKKYCVGDIHGNYLALLDLLTIINFDYENDQLIILGDVVDGWPQTYECIELLKRIKNLIKVKGNHDEWTIQFLSDVIRDPEKDKHNLDKYSWLHHGGTATVESYLNGNNSLLLDEHVNFLNEALNYYIDDNDNLFIHAGYYPTVIPIKNKNIYDSSFMWDRLYVRTKLINSYGLPQFKGDKNFNKVFIGHTPTIALEHKNIKNNNVPIINKNIYLMDTGVAFTGFLSCINLDTLEVTQSSKTGWEYYPDYKGRNTYTYNQYTKNNE